MFSLAEDTTAIIDRNGLQMTLRCGRCRGTGSSDLVRKVTVCNVCKGLGTHTLVVESQSSVILSCGYCRGTGTQNRDGLDPLCPICKGLGSGESNHPSYQCKRCSGSGHESGGVDDPCEECHGWGALSGTR